jgi:predicted nicotinamide N-methyase
MPVWSREWPGGLALARYIEENPAIVEGKSVLDVATGTGMVANAAVQVGCRSIYINDIEMAALLKMAPFPNLMGLIHGDFAGIDPSGYDVIFIADHWYDSNLYEKTIDWVRAQDPVLVVASSVMRRDASEVQRLEEPDFELLHQYWVESPPGTEETDYVGVTIHRRPKGGFLPK